MSKRLVSALAAIAVFTAPSLLAGEIIHDAEYYVLEAQHGERWAEQDKELKAKLAELREKHGAPPNIIHIMWDDTPVGEVGIPHIQKMRGWETPNINKFGAEGIFSPGCTRSPPAPRAGPPR